MLIVLADNYEQYMRWLRDHKLSMSASVYADRPEKIMGLEFEMRDCVFLGRWEMVPLLLSRMGRKATKANLGGGRMSDTDNGEVTIQCVIGRTKRVIRTVRGRITAKRVSTSTRTWDHSGKRISKYRIGMNSQVLLSFKRDGGDMVVVSAPWPDEMQDAPKPTEAENG